MILKIFNSKLKSTPHTGLSYFEIVLCVLLFELFIFMHLDIIFICRSVLHVPKGYGEGKILISHAFT